MPDIHIHRDHHLGFKEARKVEGARMVAVLKDRQKAMQAAQAQMAHQRGDTQACGQAGH